MSSIESQLGGRVEHDWRPDGVSCVISIPLVRTFEPAGNGIAAGVKANGSATTASADAARPRRSWSSKMKRWWRCRCTISCPSSAIPWSGPVGRVTEALRILNQQPVDAAILDVNLAGEFVYPLAELLRTRNIPFVFATGYSPESIDPRFGDISVLQKPIDRQTLEAYFSRRVVFAIGDPRQPKRTIQVESPIDGQSHLSRLALAPPPDLKRGAMRCLSQRSQRALMTGAALLQARPVE